MIGFFCQASRTPRMEKLIASWHVKKKMKSDKCNRLDHAMQLPPNKTKVTIVWGVQSQKSHAQI